MKKELNRTRKCPKCGAEYQGHPAISRRDNKTPICPDCGTKLVTEFEITMLEYKGLL